MKLLLDEQIDVRFKGLLTGLPAYTLLDMGWQGLKNGVLTQKMNESAFSFFVTADKTFRFSKISTTFYSLFFCLIHPRFCGNISLSSCLKSVRL